MVVATDGFFRYIANRVLRTSSPIQLAHGTIQVTSRRECAVWLSREPNTHAGNITHTSFFLSGICI